MSTIALDDPRHGCETDQLCECGCGEPAPIAKWNNARLGHKRGKPVRFISGHNQRGKPKSEETRARMSEYASNRPPEHHEKLVATRRARPLVETASSSSIHAWLDRRYPKTNHCEMCGERGRTDYAYLNHPAPHTRNRDDYWELCRSCHVLYDTSIGMRGK